MKDHGHSHGSLHGESSRDLDSILEGKNLNLHTSGPQAEFLVYINTQAQSLDLISLMQAHSRDLISFIQKEIGSPLFLLLGP